MSRKSNLPTEKPLHDFIPIDYHYNKVNDLPRVHLLPKMAVNTQIPVHREINQYLGHFKNDGLSNNPYKRPHTAYDTPIYRPPDNTYKRSHTAYDNPVYRPPDNTYM